MNIILKKVGENKTISTNFLYESKLVTCTITQSVVPGAIAIPVKSVHNRPVLVILGCSDGQFNVPSITTK